MRFQKKRGFTLTELLVCLAIVAATVGMTVPALWSSYRSGSTAVSAQMLHQLSTAGNLYLADNNGVYWDYSTTVPATGIRYWFGFDTNGPSVPEGQRTISIEEGILGPYLSGVGVLRSDSSFLRAGSAFKSKFRNLRLGFGYNTLLGTVKKPGKPSVAARRVGGVSNPAQIVVFSTSANITTLAPASIQNPMLEEFYMVNDEEYTMHFRHGDRAMAAFANGSVGFIPKSEGTPDTRLPSANVGRPASKYVNPSL